MYNQNKRPEYPLLTEETERACIPTKGYSQFLERNLDIYSRVTEYGEHIHEIAKELGISRQAVSQTVRRIAKRINATHMPHD